MAAGEIKRFALIVDGHHDSRMVAKELLEALGLVVVVASDPREAREAMKSQKFDLLMLDTLLPRESGVAFLISLRDEATRLGQKEFPAVVVASSNPLPPSICNTMTRYLGVKLALTKPFDPMAIIEFVSSQFSKKAVTPNEDAATLSKLMNATKEAISLNTQVSPVAGKAFVRVDAQALGEFTGIIEIRSSAQQGFVALTFERNCCEGIARRIFQDQGLVINDAVLRDISGEMCNQVIGNLQAQLLREGTRFEISVPTIISGQKYQIDHRLDAPSIIIPFEWDGTRFYTQFVIAKRLESAVCVESVPEEPANLETLDSGEINFL